MRRWWDRLFVVIILVVAAGAIYAVWPDEPDRYMPSWLNLPSGQGIPGKVLGYDLPCHDDRPSNPSDDCKGMTLGLDLQGGSRITLQADVAGKNLSDDDIDSGLNAAKEIIENRVNPFGVAESIVQRAGKDRLVVELPGVSADVAKDITRPAVLMFCEPLQQGGQGVGAGAAIAVVSDGLRVAYQPGTCAPDVTAEGVLMLNDDGTTSREQPTYAPGAGSAENIVWTPGIGDLNGAPTVMTGSFLKSNATVLYDPTFGTPRLLFEMTKDGEKVMSSLTGRMTGLPLATFLDGEPVRGAEDGDGDGKNDIIAPTVQSTISDSGVTTGLSGADAQRLKTFLNNGAFPIPLRIVQQQDVDATLGDQAVLNSVEAGIVALLLIMAFMILYYRLPGILASTALVVYTAILLAIFKIGVPFVLDSPVTLTLAGIAAFVLSIGMAVDANILIFERMKEELRNGRSLVPSVEAGFDRAWSSIRDSNVSTLITCGILYWMGNAFASSLIKGFALTLAIGVLISMFSAITVTRTLLRMTMGTPLARALWLWTDDKPDVDNPMSTRPVAGMEGAENA